MSNEPPRPVAPPLDQLQSQAPAAKKNKMMLIVILALAFLGCIILLVILYILSSTGAGKNNPTTNPASYNTTPTSPTTTPTTPTPTPGIADGLVFYVQKTNIFSYNVSTKVITQWTSYPANPTSTPATDSAGNPIPSIQINNLYVIDSNTLGFAKCAIITGDFGCGVEVMDLTTKTITEKEKLSSDKLLLTLGFSTPDKYAYLDTNATNWQLFYSNAGSVTALEDIVMGAYGRGGFIEDSDQIRFAPDGLHLFQIATSSPRDVSDFNIYVYKLSDSSKEIVTNATQPKWIDNSTILFRAYGKTLADADKGLAKYSLDTHVQQKVIYVSNDSYTPSVFDTTKALYTNLVDNQVWVYNMTLNTQAKIIDSATDGKWVTTDKVVYIAMIPCVSEEDCGMTAFPGVKPGSLSVYDQSTLVTDVIPVDVTTISDVTTEVN